MKQTSSSKSRRGPGRPPGSGGRRPARTSGDSRSELLAAARTEFARHGFRGTTVRHVADRAGVTPAMVHYHFKDKRGLYLAMLAETFDPLVERLNAIAADGRADSLHGAVTAYMQLFARTPELPALLMRDVLSEDAAMRDTFIREFASRAAAALRRILERDIAAGRLRKDIDPRLALLSLISLTAFPFVARPVAGSLLGLAYDDAMITMLAAHTVKIFYQGVAQPGAPS